MHLLRCVWRFFPRFPFIVIEIDFAFRTEFQGFFIIPFLKIQFFHVVLQLFNLVQDKLALLADESLPEGACGLYLGGGYPELFAGALAANAPMREAVRAAVAGGLPTVAECGGFLYLNRLLSDGEGRDWPMAGALPGRAANTGKLGRFGYVTLTAKKDGLLGPAGTRLPAHEFHYWDSDAPGSGFRADKPQSSRGWDCAFHTPTLYAGFPHFHFWAAPSAARNFVAAARRYVQEASL